MRKWLFLAVLGFWVPRVAMAAADNRPADRLGVADRFWPADYRQTFRFTVTSSSNNAVIPLVSSATFVNLVTVAPTSFNPALNTSTFTTYGGRGYMAMQVVSAQSNVYIDFTSVDLSTVTSPYLVQGDWFSPDDPVAWQGEMYAKSPSTFTITGWLWFDKSR